MRFALASITMLFIALTSAYVVRQGLDPEWRAIQRPAILWINTIVLLASSFTIEKARRATRSGTSWLFSTLLLGVAFVIGQLIAWRELSDQGVYLSTSPHSSFFYLLTGLHGLHLLGGIVALTYIALRGLDEDHLPRWVGATALYWHFMDGLWIYLFVLLFGWR
jgi:cytochrome c oxidase subunit III